MILNTAGLNTVNDIDGHYKKERSSNVPLNFHITLPPHQNNRT